VNISFWPGVKSGSNAFIVPIYTNTIFLPDSKFMSSGSPAFVSDVSTYPTDQQFPLPTWWLEITNRVVYALIDTSVTGGKVLDFVNMDDLTSRINISEELFNPAQNNSPISTPAALRSIWNTNRIGGNNISLPTIGIQKQIEISRGHPHLSDDEWRTYDGTEGSKANQTTAFSDFMSGQGVTLAWQTPFNPTKQWVDTKYWEANDPLVHYMSRDLLDNYATNTAELYPGEALFLRKTWRRYQPWGGNHVPDSTFQDEATDPEAFDFSIKDPGVTKSDDWNFPTNKFPNIGWLGRVHRGTPWQTIYLKSALPNGTNWMKWAARSESYPTNDWHLMDIFTTSPNDNAASGLLSINQTNEAAWSAVLSGLVIVSNSTPATNVIIAPNSPQIRSIVSDLNAVRQLQPNQVFHSIGDILAAQSLSLNNTNGVLGSQFLDLSNDGVHKRLTDQIAEWIPQQIMSLLKLGEPRYVVYCYGQSLKPANNSLVLSPPSGSGLFNLCTNYQITGEVLTRTVLRVEKNPDAQHPKAVIESYNVLPAD
jgi:hypothetical protein